MYKVYIWTNKINGKKYVGVTRSSMAKRAGQDGYHYKGSPRFYAAIQKYGFANFEVSIVKDGLTQEQAAKMESVLIKELNTMDPAVGYNLQEGGFPATTHCDKTRRQKISDTLKATRSTDEYRLIMSERMKAVWDCPEKRAAMIAKRALKPTSGRQRIKVFCEETGILYDSLHAVTAALGVSFSCLSVRFKKAHNGIIKIGGRCNRPVYTLHKVTVHNKESELLETSAGSAGGNQQPSIGIDSQPGL